MIQALAVHKHARSIKVYTHVFALDVAAMLAVPFSGEGGAEAAVGLNRTLAKKEEQIWRLF